MTDDEWDAIALVIAEGWGDFPDSKARVYRMFLDAYPAEAVMVALHRLAQNGKPWLPKVPELVKSLRDVSVPPVPSWPEAWAMLQRTMKRAGRRSPLESGCRDAMVWLRAEGHPVVAAFADVEDLRQLCMTEFWDPEWGPARVAKLEQRWTSFVGVAQERLDRGLAIESHARRNIGPARFDPTKALSFIRDPPKELGSGDG